MKTTEAATARLLFPALRSTGNAGFDHEHARIDRALELGVGGFVVFGGTAAQVEALTTDLRARARTSLLIGSDLERGAGQQFAGATALPPLAAIGSLDEPEFTRRAAQITAREAMALGVNWIYAPVADVDLEPRNPIVGTRAFGTDATHVQRHVRAWIEGCHASGVLACAKHFPGHGRTTSDSHAALPRVDVSRAALETDLAPFRSAIEAGVDTLMTAHVAYPALDPQGGPATLSRAIITDLLKGELGYDGAVVTDALIMQGVLDGTQGEGHAAVRAAIAGCDALLYPQDLDAVVTALDRALDDDLSEARVRDANDRLDALVRRAGPPGGVWGRDLDRRWANELAVRTLTLVRGVLRHDRTLDLITIDDDIGGPFDPPSRAPFVNALRDAGLDVHEVEHPGERHAMIAVYADIRAWKAGAGLSASAFDRLQMAVSAQPDALVVLFGHPRIAADMPGTNVLAAWGGEAVMQRAAAQRLAGH